MAQLYKISIAVCCLVVAVLADEHARHGTAERHEAHYRDGGEHDPMYDEEALLGSHHNEELADMSDDERIARLQSLAKTHDTNNNDIIETEELKQWILQSFKNLDREEAKEKMDEDDEDQDGKITFAEILQKTYGYKLGDLEEMQKKEGTAEEKEVLEVIADDKLRFEAADLNKDESLDEEEFLAYYQPYDFPHMFGVEMDKAMKDHDKDKDGAVTFEEFLGDHGGELDEEHRLSEKTNFEKLDTDKDGKLSREELKPWVITDNNEVADEEVQHLVQQCDEDNDGHLSIDEIVNKEDEFISSSITDYGRSLYDLKDEL